MSNPWGRVTSASYISTGCLRVDHSIGDTDYTASFTMNQSGIYCTLEGIYSTYCFIYCRNFSGGLVNGDFTFVLQRVG